MIMLIIGDNVCLNGFYVFLLITYIVEILVSIPMRLEVDLKAVLASSGY